MSIWENHCPEAHLRVRSSSRGNRLNGSEPSGQSFGLSGAEEVAISSGSAASIHSGSARVERVTAK